MVNSNLIGSVRKALEKLNLSVFPNLNWCRSLKLDYLNLYLIHWSIGVKSEKWYMPYSECLVPFNLKDVWAAMEEAHRLGPTKSIFLARS